MRKGLVRLQPVSYTHLDVYKRQTLNDHFSQMQCPKPVLSLSEPKCVKCAEFVFSKYSGDTMLVFINPKFMRSSKGLKFILLIEVEYCTSD